MESTTVAVTVDFSPQLTEVGEAETVTEAGGPMTLTVVVAQTSTAFNTATQPWIVATPGVGDDAWSGLQFRIAPGPVPRLADSMVQLVGPETVNWTSVPGKIGLPLASTIFMRIRECDVLLRAGMISTVFGVAEIVVPAAAAEPLQITLNVKAP